MEWLDTGASAYRHANGNKSSGTRDTKRYSLDTQFLGHIAPNSGPFHLFATRIKTHTNKQNAEIIICGSYANITSRHWHRAIAHTCKWTICNYALYRHLRIAFLHSIAFYPLRKIREITLLSDSASALQDNSISIGHIIM